MVESTFRLKFTRNSKAARSSSERALIHVLKIDRQRIGDHFRLKSVHGREGEWVNFESETLSGMVKVMDRKANDKTGANEDTISKVKNQNEMVRHSVMEQGKVLREMHDLCGRARESRNTAN